MALKRITMQQLADACGLSRNTVSKVFNDRGAVPDTTRQMVMQKAKELGFYTGVEEKSAQTEPQRMPNIALLARHIPEDVHFGPFSLPAFTERISLAGYTLTIHEISPEELLAYTLPSHMSLNQTAGIFVIELFNQKYMDMLCGLGLPCVSVDACIKSGFLPQRYDSVYVENLDSSAALTAYVIAKGAKRLGFVGDPNHCNSFHQRWIGFRSALEDAGLPLDEGLCILDPSRQKYSDEDWLFMQIQGMESKPDALICANDFLAIRIITVLKRIGMSVPEDVMVTGFNGTPQSAIVEPSLTTVQVPNSDIGRMVADMLLNRIKNPDRPFFSIYVESMPIWRNSTARQQN